MLTIEEWHQRYSIQARWTESVRRFLYQKAGITRAETILEVGCGTGVILADLCVQSKASIFGIDLQLAALKFARPQNWAANKACANAFHLPFASASFSITCCHYFLLWAADPLQALLEMKRVTRPGGAILAMAEPDYGGRVDYPAALGELGTSQTRALLQQFANPFLGRKLKSLFHQTGLQAVEAGVLGGQWGEPPTPEEWSSEWRVLENDIQAMLTPQRLSELKKQDQQAWQNGDRILFVPTFFAFGMV